MRDEQRKIIKYNHLIANLLIFHTVVGKTHVLDQAGKEGIALKEDALAAISPYHTEHINRFGHYALDLDRSPIPLPFFIPATTEPTPSKNTRATFQAPTIMDYA